MKRCDNNYLVVKEEQRIDEQLAASEAWRNSDGGKAEHARLYADEIALADRVKVICGNISDLYERVETAMADGRTDAEYAAMSAEYGYSVDDLIAAYYGE